MEYIAGAGEVFAVEGDGGWGHVLAGDVGLVHVVAAGEEKGRNEDWFRGGRTSECLEVMNGKNGE